VQVRMLQAPIDTTCRYDLSNRCSLTSLDSMHERRAAVVVTAARSRTERVLRNVNGSSPQADFRVHDCPARVLHFELQGAVNGEVAQTRLL
jgi:hypothetical protein